MSPTVLRCAVAVLFCVSGFASAEAQDFKKQVIYQIITDRFVDGDTSNNNPSQSSGLYDATKTNWHLYWGGDLAGIQSKISYLKGMGITAIWISPPVDNLNLNIPDGSGNPTASYHGYGARDFKRIEEHFGDTANDWTAFDNLASALHSNGMKLIVDFAPNHTNSNNAGEFGSLYDNGTFVAAYNNDPNGIFHHNADISDFTDRYQLQYDTLEGLADLNQENPTVDAYLKAAMLQLQSHGADAFRIDAVKHVTWGWEYSMANTAFTSGPSFFFGEWFQGINDPLYHDSYKFANKSSITLIDFPLNQAIRDVFISNNNFSEIDNQLSAENSNFTWQNDLVTFVDNHDMARFLSVNNNTNRLNEALAFVLTCRGIPVIYYGDEQYLHNDTGGGTDPYNRNPMTSFATTTTPYKFVGSLAGLRQSNPALAYGTSTQRWINNDVYIFERKFFNDVVLVAINKNDTTGYSISGLDTALPAGSYSDYLSGLLGGLAISVSSGTGGNNPVTSFNLPAHAVSVWQFTSSSTSAPEVGSIGPTMGQPGVRVTVAGKGFGSSTGSVKFGATAATINAWSDTSVTFTVPNVASGVYNVQLANSGSVNANTIQFTVLTAKMIPVTFTVNNATPTNVGDYIFLTGSVVELSNWGTTFDTAVGPMLDPNYPSWFLNASVPAGQTIQFKFIKIAANGAVTWEGGSNHVYTVPTSGTGFVNVTWQN